MRVLCEYERVCIAFSRFGASIVESCSSYGQLSLINGDRQSFFHLVRVWLSIGLPVSVLTTVDFVSLGRDCRSVRWVCRIGASVVASHADCKTEAVSRAQILLGGHSPLTSFVRWSHSSSDRKLLNRKALGFQLRRTTLPRHSSCGLFATGRGERA